MQFKKTALSWLIFIIPALSMAQSVNLPQGAKESWLLNRMDIKLMNDSALGFSTTKPYLRKTMVAGIEQYYGRDSALFTATDLSNMHDALMNSSEWVSGDLSPFQSKKPLLGAFYKTKGDLFQVNQKDFFLAINPVIQQIQGAESGNGSSRHVYLNSKGVSFRGLIAKKIGFSLYATDNQERPSAFVQQWEQKFDAVPGAGFYKPFKTTGYDYFDARGSIHFNATKYINIQFGYDRNFIGDGYRSLFLSDFANSYLFLKLNTRIWKINYQNIFMELSNGKSIGDKLLPKKYASMHHLSLQVTKWLNIGLFESVVFGRANHYEFGYLNPIIFLRSAEQQNGSPDNANVGFNFKANIAHTVQLYGQLMLDEFVLNEVKSGRGWWGNKQGIQAGFKYIDAFKIKNFDLQGEINWVRPFTYSHYDSVANYSHYNQPLAHPLGANFTEAIGIIRYQPAPKWNIQAKLIVFRQGLDTAGSDYGSNIFILNGNRAANYGYSTGGGVRSTGANASLWIGYELLQNLFIDGSVMYRKLSVPVAAQLSRKSTLFSIGLRLNMFRREYDY
ncbi:MAG: hypothetical protein ABIQ88_23275 [Chitinophagaceae bacterium]